MKKIKGLQTLLIFALCMTVPSWGVQAALDGGMPMLNMVPGAHPEAQAFNLQDIQISSKQILLDMDAFETHPVTDLEFLASEMSSDETLLSSEVTADEIIETLPEQLAGDKGFWSSREFKIIGGAILLAGLIVGLMMLFAGSGGGSGAGGVGGGPSGGSPFSPFEVPGGGGGNGGGGEGGGGDGGNGLPGGGGGTGDGGGEGDGDPDNNFRVFDPNNVPTNPEPSTMLMFGLGALMPLLKRKSWVRK